MDVFFIINVSNEIEENDIIKIHDSFSKIISNYRSVPRLYNNCFINVITFGNNEVNEILIRHPLEQPIYINLKFGGNGNIIQTITVLKKRIDEIRIKKLYSPTVISFIKSAITKDLENELLLLNKILSFRPFNYDYPEIFINQYIEDNYLIFLKRENMKNLNDNLGNIIYIEDIDKYSFQGEIKDKNEINLAKLPSFKNSKIVL